MKRAIVILAVAVLGAACDQKPAETKTDDTKATASAAATAATPPPIAEADLSTPADFEEAAEKSITKASYKADLAALEADISKE